MSEPHPNKACIICNGKYTVEQIFDARDYKLDRQICQVHINAVCELILKYGTESEEDEEP